MENEAQVIEPFEVTHSESIAKLTEALAKAQLSFKPVLKQSENPAYMRGGKASRYADLATVIEATQPSLAAEGLVITQWPNVNVQDKSTKLVSLLMHSSGEWLKGVTTLPAVNRDAFTAQSCGSAITYARRYSYSAIIGVAPEEDDDGNAASLVGSKQAAEAVAAKFIEEHGNSASKKAAKEIAEVPKAHIPESLDALLVCEGPLNDVKRYKAKSGNPYLRLKQNGVDMVMWDNYAMPLSGESVPVFNVLLTAKDKFCQFKGKKGDKGYTVIRVMQIGDKKWDEAGQEYRDVNDDIAEEAEPGSYEMTDEVSKLWPK